MTEHVLAWGRQFSRTWEQNAGITTHPEKDTLAQRLIMAEY
jgi:hypothetical protein